MNAKEQARTRAEMIMKVRSGQLSVKAAAELLGISRKTYYEWEAKGLGGMLRNLEDQEAGRPSEQESAEVLAMKAKIAELEGRLSVACQTAEIRAVLMAMDRAAAKKKKSGSRK